MTFCALIILIRLGGTKSKQENRLCCCRSLDKVLRDLLLQGFVHCGCVAVPLQFAELTENKIVGSLSKMLPQFKWLWVSFFSCSLLSWVIHALTGCSQRSAARNANRVATALLFQNPPKMWPLNNAFSASINSISGLIIFPSTVFSLLAKTSENILRMAFINVIGQWLAKFNYCVLLW